MDVQSTTSLASGGKTAMRESQKRNKPGGAQSLQPPNSKRLKSDAGDAGYENTTVAGLGATLERAPDAVVRLVVVTGDVKVQKDYYSFRAKDWGGESDASVTVRACTRLDEGLTAVRADDHFDKAKQLILFAKMAEGEAGVVDLELLAAKRDTSANLGLAWKVHCNDIHGAELFRALFADDFVLDD